LRDVGIDAQHFMGDAKMKGNIFGIFQVIARRLKRAVFP